MQVEENMKAVDVIPLLTAPVMEKIEAVVQSKPKRPEAYRWMQIQDILFMYLILIMEPLSNLVHGVLFIY